MSKIVDFVKKNKYVLMFLLMLFILLSFCHFNTFLANDDLPYSFFKRLNVRVTYPFQVIWDNLRYYKSTNGRFILHCIIMSLLMFGKNLWALLNPLIIVSIIFIIFKLCVKNTDKKNQILTVLLSSTLFLMLYSYKSIIYWVSGSVNYLWTCAFLFIYVYLYMKFNIFKYKKTNYFLLFILSTLHENTFVFLLVFIICLNVIEYIKTKKVLYWRYIIPIMLGGAILLLAPGNLARNGSYSEWYEMNLFEKLNLSLPVVSKSVFNLLNIDNLIPTIYILIIIFKLILNKYPLKIRLISSLLISLISLIAIFTNNSYVYVVLAVTLFAIETYIHIFDKEVELIPVQFGFYAITFSMIITPLYNSFRPNLLVHIYFIFIICKFIIDMLNDKKIIKVFMMIFVSILFLIMCVFEVSIYYNIGKYHRIRLSQIEKHNENPNDTLYLTKIPDKYIKYHQDCNSVNENFWTYKWFVWYYDIDEGTMIKYK